MTAPAPAALHIDGVSVNLAGARIIDQVTLRASGNVVGLVGPNGSGKSTLLRTVYRMLQPADGQVRAAGDDVWAMPARDAARVTAAVVQDSPADLELTVADCVATGRLPHNRLLGGGHAEDRDAVDKAMAAAGVTGFADRDVSTLSGGERQRVQLARALAQEPQILVLDEPTNHLDIRHQLQLLGLVRNLQITTLVTLHDLNLAAAYCDEIVMLERGRVVAAGTPSEVFTPPLLHQVFGVRADTLTNPLTGRLQLVYADK
ncbi:ABC transporter ATP-binding protein [Curtobacterium sp. Csp1]|uniref:ABC transporter ATP-binding protein n=1 Tax=Curtobacterium sp. Csp1 TaxID=2495429 RepID=UPI001597D253|nr:ABC transporter ATP-binding protein [Curtobacterium sp. Csp1]QKS19433.1 ABC transporter ATP-binding protein [Curtobacterium sp. Csp1]